MKFIEAKSWEAAKRKYPEAQVIAKVEGGYMCFLTLQEYDTWKQQK
jgi:hypothetical protein